MATSIPTQSDFAKPDFITGGCLCGSIRYRVEFPKDHDFLASVGLIVPPSHRIELTRYRRVEVASARNARRNSGALISYAHAIKARNFTYTMPTTTLKCFQAIPKYQRGFCSRCGSFLYWQEETSDELEFAVGTVDPEFLVGEEGKHDGYGYALANCSGDNIFCANEIQGVTDGWIGKTGKRWATTTAAAIPAPASSYK